MSVGTTARKRLGAKGLIAGSIVLMLALGMAVTSLAPITSRASSHREAPLTAADPQVDTTDTYAFTSPNFPSTVTLIANYIPFEEPAGGPNFYPFAAGNVRYDINIDNDGDAGADIIYRWVFQDHRRNPGTFLYNTGQVTSLTDPNLNFFQTYNLYRIRPGKGWRRLASGVRAAPSDVGRASMPDYAALRSQAIKQFNGGKVFAGQADDPFFLDLRIFDLLYGANFSEVGDDTLAGFNVNTLAIQVPKTAVAKKNNPEKNNVIGVWATASRQSTRVIKGNGTQTHSGRYVQVSRLGSPLVNEVVIPVKHKDRWNASRPAKDAQFLPYVNDPIVPHVVQAIYGIAPPDSNPNKSGIQRADLIQVFLTGVPGLNQPARVTPSEQLRLNLQTPPCQPGACANFSRLGVIGGDVAGYPNGRRLQDDVVDIALQVVEGELIGNPNNLGDGVNTNDRPFTNLFPYVPLPHRGSDPSPHS